MDKAAFVKFGARVAIGIAGSVLIGYTIKAERIAKDKIDAHFSTETEPETPEITES